MENKTEITTSLQRQTSKKSFEIDHLTTTSFMRPMPVCSTEVFPSREIKACKVETFMRLDPLPVPTFGRARVANRAFFVPYRTIMKYFTEFIEETPVPYEKTATLIDHVPQVSNGDLISIFAGSTLFATTTTGNSFDFKVNGGTKYVLTPVGCYALKILNSLGYQINWHSSDTSVYSLLPFYAFVKVFFDWYMPSQYYMNNNVADWVSLFESPSGYAVSPSPDMFRTFFLGCFTSYDLGQFASAFDNPVGPNSTSFEIQHSIGDATTNPSSNDVSRFGALGTPVVETSHQDAVLSQYLVDALRSLTDYSKRHALSSVRAVDRYLAEYGINLSSEIMRRSIYLGFDEFSLQFGDVMSHSESSDMPLGGYAGKSVGYGQKSFSLDKSDEFGLFLVINTVTPVVKTYQGQDRQTMHLTPLDFFKGDFDHLGAQAISQREVFVPSDGSANSAVPSNINNHIFGWFPRYSEYSIDKGMQTGLYALNTKNALLESYSLFRNVAVHVSSSGLLTHSINCASGADAYQYNRIFRSSGDNFDKINVIHHCEFIVEDNSSPVFDVYDFDDYDKKKSVVMNVQGTTVN